MTIEWRGAPIDPDAEAAPPEPETWEELAVPGRPPSLAGADAAAFRGRFADPRETTTERGLLVVRGAYARAEVWINGERVAEGSHVAPIRVPFEPEPSNEVIVACYAPTDRFGGVEDTDAVPARTSVPSIRGGVDVRAVPAAYIHDLAVRGDLEDDPSFEVTATVDAGEAVDDHLTLSLRPEGFRGGGSMERVAVEAEAGQRVRVQRSVRVRNARRWWPRELGSQLRYTVRATLDEHERTVTTGLVSVERDGGDLLLNGERHRPRGFTVAPTTDPEEAVEHALDANATLLRARGHVPDERLAEACDEAGLLYWQDLPLTGSGAFDAEEGQRLAKALVAARGHHPSLVCYGVHDDPVRPFDDGLGAGSLDRLRFRWRAWRAGYDSADAEVLAAALPSDRVVFTVAGPPGIDPDAAHLYPGWSYLDAADVDWLVERSPSLGEVVGATGAGAVSRPTEAPVPGFEPSARGDDLADDVEASQREQERVVTTVLDALRRREAGTVVLDSLADVAAEGGMGVVAADGEPKPAYRAAADAFEPVQAVLDGPPTGGAVGVTVCNDTPKAREGELAWTAGGRSGSVDVEVAAFDRADAGAVDLGGDPERCTLELRLGEETVTNTYDLTLWE